MDRRDALKKLGLGGATAVGASVVLSSPALAAGTAGCVSTGGNPIVSISKSGNASQNQASVTLTLTGLGTINCPCNAGGPTQVGAPFSWSLSPNAGAGTSSGNSHTWTGLGRATYTYGFSVKVSCLDAGGIAICAVWTGAGTFTVDAGQSAPVLSGPVGTLNPASC